MIKTLFPDFPAYATFADKLGWYALRLACIAILLFLLLPCLHLLWNHSAELLQLRLCLLLHSLLQVSP